MTSCVVIGDCISPKTWYLHRNIAKQGRRVWHFVGWARLFGDRCHCFTDFLYLFHISYAH